MISEAVDTFDLIIKAAIAWAALIGGAVAFVLAVVCIAIGPLVVPTARKVRRAPAWARGHIAARRIARATRPDYDEAA
ncbi:hypothetical protein ACQEV9_18065 [Streptomyces chartreusis]|uniref:hypothetical protein n=1 Tax=Streptomyces chartreusis TaxID=1969 RepID=UPI003D8B615D